MTHRIKWTKDLVNHILRNPHIIGHMVGKDLLTELHSQWILEVWGKPSGIHTGLMAHRGAYKTTAITEIGIIWWWLFHPGDRIALVRKTFTSASESLGVITQLMEREEIRELFRLVHGKAPEFTTKRDDRLDFDFKTSITKEGSLGAYGIHQLPTGLHCDRAICDDITTKEDRYSKTEREKTVRDFQELVTNIIDRGKSVLLVGTPWHRDDVWSKVADIKCRLGVKKYPRDVTGLISDAQYAQIIDGQPPSLVAANYELRHIASDDMLFQIPAAEHYWLNTYDFPVVAHLDAKFQGDHTTALTIMQQLPTKAPNGNPWIQATGWCSPKHVEMVADEIVDRCIRMKVRYFFNENNPDKGMLFRMLMGKFKERKYQINPVTGRHEFNYAEHQNKQYKIQTHLLHHWKNIQWDTSCQAEYLNQIKDYQEGAQPDDCPDSAASLLRCFFDKTATKTTGWMST